MQVVNVTRNKTLCDRCRFADTFFKRLVGLLNRNSMKQGEGLLIDKCHGIHTVGMRFAIDVLFLDQSLRVMRIAKGVRPFRVGPVVNDAIYVLELPAGVLDGSGTEVGDQIQLRSGAETRTGESPGAIDPAVHAMGGNGAG